jgi:hypothetical protein
MRRLTLLVSLLLPLLTTGAAESSTAAPLRFFPAPGATNVCPDTPLRFALSAPAAAAAAGKIEVHDAASGAVVQTIDLSQEAPQRIVGGASYTYQPVLIADREAIAVPAGVLKYGHDYYVTYDAGVVTAGGAPVGALTDPAGWRFSTKPAPPAAGTARLVVAADGTGDFCTVQGGIDFVPAHNTQRVVLELRAGVYRELVNLPKGKNLVTLRGEDRKRTIITYANNARINPRVRAVFDVYADDFRLENLRLENTTPRGGSQAEALRVRADRARIADCDFSSLQDTLQLTGRVYVTNCYVEGDVDFVWGSGTVFFDRCELKALNNGYLVQSRNDAQHLGYIFADCRLTTAPGVTRYILARIEPSRFPSSHVAFLNCALGPHLTGVGWQFDRAPGSDEVGPTDKVRFQEFRSTDLAGRPLPVTARHPASRQLSVDEAAKLRDLGHVFGNWNPLP